MADASEQVKNALGVEDDIVGADLRVRPNHPGVKDETMNSKRIQPASPSTEKFDRLKAILREMFQLDRGDLDFGLYRIMNLKAKEIEEFLDNDLLPQVRTALVGNTTDTLAALEEKLAEARRQAMELGVDPEAAPKVEELKQQLAEAKADLSAETDVYNHLANFFARYYDEGDFMSLRRYSGGGQPTYLIPYDGEEVKLHWANADQYYVKTTENYSSYVFTVGMGAKTRRVRFEIVAANNEKDNVKEASGKQRRFLLAGENAEVVTFDGADLVVHFAHRPLTDREKKTFSGTGSKQQDRINEAIAKRILHTLQPDWQALLTASAPTEHDPERTVLDKHLAAYSAKNSFDYFIHKDLGWFLRRELDFYLKSEVLNLDDLALGDAARLDRALARMRAVRHVADKIIDFLAQLENFQKQLWLKKKFILDTQYCVTLDRVSETLYSEIAANESQHDEWIKLFAIDEITNENSPLPTAGEGQGEGDQGNGTPYTNPSTVDFLKANPYLVLDTRHFNANFTDRLLAGISEAGPLDEQLNGLLVHSENFQALNLLKARYQGQVNCIYIDPPYNTDSSPILYKNDYKDSSWLSMMERRLSLAKTLLQSNGILCCAIDDEEAWRLRALLQGMFAKEIGVAPVRSTPVGRTSRGKLSPTHEYALFYGGENTVPGPLIKTEKEKRRYPLYDEGGHYAWRNLLRTGTNDKRADRPKLYYPIFVGHDDVLRIPKMKWDEQKTEYQILESPKKNETVVWPIKKQDGKKVEKNWERGWERVAREADKYRVQRKKEDSGAEEISIHFIQRMDISSAPKTWWGDSKYASSNHGAKILNDLFVDSPLDFPKSVALVEDCIRTSGGGEQGSQIVDYFAGSGTTGHAVINLHRIDGEVRKYILVEVAQYFDTVLLPRIKKVVYSSDWKDGKPVSRKGVSQFFKYVRIESYEDTLDSLEVTPPNSAQRDLLAQNPALAEDYRLRYALGVETSCSACLLGKNFADPFAYTLSVVRDGTRREIPVDLPETFNYLLGLHVESRRLVDAVLTITGTDAEGKHSLILWRNLNETDNAALEKWFARHRAKFVQSLDIIYTNGDHTLNALKKRNETWTAKTIEPVFRELMFKEVP
ncbi:MAG: DNA methyltransferase [Nitrospira sp.]|nr:DNA methyltransferase [Nitrospira sp.]